MTVKVINKTPDPRVLKRVVCRGCGVTLEYTPNDVSIAHKLGDLKFGERAPKIWMITCVCDRTVILKREKAEEPVPKTHPLYGHPCNLKSSHPAKTWPNINRRVRSVKDAHAPLRRSGERDCITFKITTPNFSQT